MHLALLRILLTLSLFSHYSYCITPIIFTLLKNWITEVKIDNLMKERRSKLIDKKPISLFWLRNESRFFLSTQYHIEEVACCQKKRKMLAVYLTGRDDSQTRQIKRRKKYNSVPRSKIMTPQTFVQVWRTLL